MGMKKQSLSDNTICSAYFYTIFIIICRNSPEHEKTVTPLSVYCAIYEYILFSQILLFNIPWFYMNNPNIQKTPADFEMLYSPHELAARARVSHGLRPVPQAICMWAICSVR